MPHEYIGRELISHLKSAGLDPTRGPDSQAIDVRAISSGKILDRRVTIGAGVFVATCAGRVRQEESVRSIMNVSATSKNQCAYICDAVWVV